MSDALEYNALPQRERRPKRMRAPTADKPAAATVQSANENLSSQPDLRDNYEYKDHTADIQIHSWGQTLEEAFEGAAIGMFNYMVPLEGVTVDDSLEKLYEVSAHDMESLLFAFLDELLFVFSTEYFLCRDIRIQSFDRDSWTIKCLGRGENYDRSKHEQGTEVKAITYSAMQIHEGKDGAEIFVIVDI
ncbi:hypothetical protein CYMTET_53670 [Cymbomonas tetramitiformis]|uniref:Archease domain-containing protein n=1 Tax=Cymbomonas tetramitiformis TaxID=36881 RepID=A0AAE0ERH8_9CHLO|nr:hypothetical protein CYMTET_53670 [Cymbomonas tetramitiformis]